MANSHDVANFYSSVIRTVIQDVRQDFLNMGVDEQALVDLQAIWEQKLLAANVFNPVDFPISSTHQREFPPTGGYVYQREQTMEFGNPGASASMQNLNYYNFPAGNNQPVRLPPAGYQQPQMQMPPQQQPPVQRPPPPQPKGPNNNVPQYDGGDDEEEEDADEIAAGKQSIPDLQVAAAPKAGEEDELGSDLDDESDAVDEEEEIDDLLLCLYEKVNRTRNKWKCNFKSGIAHIGGHDFAFTKLNGDFEW